MIIKFSCYIFAFKRLYFFVHFISAICFLAYFGVSAVVTMMVPYTELDLNAAVAVVFQQRKVKVIGTFIAAGATTGLLGNICHNF